MRLVLSLVFVVGCSSATVGTTKYVSTPKDSAARCAKICHDLDLGLDAVVVMADNVGCVCTPAPPAGAPVPAAHSGAAAGGMAAILLEAAARKRRNR